MQQALPTFKSGLSFFLNVILISYSRSQTSDITIPGCVQKFPDWVDNEIYPYNNKH
jgi:hypothetical protein